MALTRDFKQAVVERVQRDPEFSRALLNEAMAVFLSDEPAATRLTLRERVGAPSVSPATRSRIVPTT